MIRFGSIFLISLIVVACASSPRVSRTFEDTGFNGTFENLLVVGVANNYSRRAEFERAVVSRLNGLGVTATAYYTVVPGNDSLTKDSVVRAIESGGFDGLLLTRIVSQGTSANLQSGSSTVTATRRHDRPFDFFRYDYDVLTDPDVINVSREGILATELYSARDKRMVWGIDTAASVESNVSATVEQIADAITGQLDRDGLLGR